MNPILLNALQPLRVTVLNSPTAVRGWAVGQILNATVLDVDTGSNAATLQIGEQKVRAQLGGTLSAGQQLPLQVLKTGEQPVLARLPETAQPLPQQLQQQALRQRLPQAIPLPLLLPALEAAARDSDTHTQAPAMKQVATTLQSLIQVLPSFEDLAQPEMLKRAMQSSGSFLESVLAHASDDELQQLLPRDFKAGLLRMADMLPVARPEIPNRTVAPAVPVPAVPIQEAGIGATAKPVPETAVRTNPVLQALAPAPDASAKVHLAEQVRAGVAHIEVNQLRSVVEADQGRNIWVVDIPVRGLSGSLNLVQLEVEEQASRRGGRTVRQWSMSVNLDLDTLGPMYARVTLADTQVHTVLWAEHPATLELVRTHVDWLQTQLRLSGLDAAEIQCLEGRPVPSAPTVPGPLLDTHV